MSELKRIPLAGVIGSPIAHSRSPRIFRHWLTKLGLAGHYIPMDVASTDLEDALRHLPKLGFSGINVTIPYKEQVLGLADQVSDRAAVIGSANTLTFLEGGKIYADNTDGHGFIENLKQNAPAWSAGAGPCVILGAGGAARAVIASFLDGGAQEIRLTNRTRSRAEALQREFGAKVQVFDWVQVGNMLDGAATVVNATSLGMVGKSEMRIPLDGLSKDATVTDLVYAPLETPLLAYAKSKGCQTVDGLGMLLYQAVPGFERWFGMTPTVDETLRAAVLR